MPKRMAQAVPENWLNQLSGSVAGNAAAMGYVGVSPSVATYTSASAVAG